MSNYNIKAKRRHHTVLVGWDPMLNTYFAHVIDENKGEDEEGRDILWIGTTPNEIDDVGVILEELNDYAYVPSDIVTFLYRDSIVDTEVCTCQGRCGTCVNAIGYDQEAECPSCPIHSKA